MRVRRRWVRLGPVVALLLIVTATRLVHPVSGSFSATTANGPDSVSASASFPTYPQQIGAGSPQLYHRLEEAPSSSATSTAADSSTNSRPGTYNGTTNGPSAWWKLDDD